MLSDVHGNFYSINCVFLLPPRLRKWLFYFLFSRGITLNSHTLHAKTWYLHVAT